MFRRGVLPRIAWGAGLVSALFYSAATRIVAQGGPTQYPQADIQYGARIYAAQCTVCHGATGNTVAGVDLGSGKFKRASSDGDLLALLATGVPGTAMPAFKFDAAEFSGVVAYLHNMRDFDARVVAVGEPGRGKVVFEGKGACAGCHRVNGRGPRVAPDLSDVGSVRTADALERTILDPSGAIQPMNRSVRAVTRDGKVITGRRLNEDTHTVQLIDQQERLVSLLKSDLREYKVIMESSMPPYKDKLAPGEVADLVAYLLSLKG